MVELIIEKWEASGFVILERIWYPWKEFPMLLEAINERKPNSQTNSGFWRFTIQTENPEEFYLQIEHPQGGGFGRLCGKMTGQRG